jgi:hypothetical protein
MQINERVETAVPEDEISSCFAQFEMLTPYPPDQALPAAQRRVT